MKFVLLISYTSTYHYCFYLITTRGNIFTYLGEGGGVDVRGRKPQHCEEELILGSSPRATPHSRLTQLLQGGGTEHTPTETGYREGPTQAMMQCRSPRHFAVLMEEEEEWEQMVVGGEGRKRKR
ncbi:hypothetical protein E2C01_009903 [Portunus trituberculatus]|uniref:Uncharacterized protein n=1 Tax=Portunus trituberculatus TaxID=210409 RepID=A0A5B7D703_PORTR|nr:hypothetical protein [Portunus trituberculatus]